MGTTWTSGGWVALEVAPDVVEAVPEAFPDVSTDTTGSGQPASVVTYLTTTLDLQSTWVWTPASTAAAQWSSGQGGDGGQMGLGAVNRPR